MNIKILFTLAENVLYFQSLASYCLSRNPEIVLKFESQYKTIQLKAIEH